MKEVGESKEKKEGYFKLLIIVGRLKEVVLKLLEGYYVFYFVYF